MNSAVTGLLLGAAAAATAVALWAGPNLAIAGPASATAVLAAGLLFAGSWRTKRAAPPPEEPAPPERDAFLFRFGFRSGRLGREEIVATLDRIDRMGPTPNLPGRSTGEMEQLVGLSSANFREYVRGRLDDLEART